MIDAVTRLARIVARTGLWRPVRPDRLLAMTMSAVRWRMSPAAAYAIGAARDPHRVALVDDKGTWTYAEVDTHTDGVAQELSRLGVGAGQRVALMARNSADFVLAQVALSKLGADILYVNTGFAGPQLGGVLADEGAVAVVADEEFVPLLDEHVPGLPRLLAWTDDERAAGTVRAAASLPADRVSPPPRDSRHIILTSGTTGRPKGAERAAPNLLTGAVELVAFLDAIPFRQGTTVLAAPAFHAWGLANLSLAMGLQSTLVMQRRFDPLRTLELVQRHRADTLAAVPVMVQRILDLPAEQRRSLDTSSLRVVALSGSALPPTLAQRFLDEMGDVLYSLYGSTEVAYVSVAGPRDLREAPGSAGRVLTGVTVRIVDDDDVEVPAGTTGRIFAGSAMMFDGYTSGEDKARLGKLAATGDVGRIGDDGRLYVEGRDDDMIVSGGENVFPAEVEDCLHRHDAVADVAVLGVEDDRFGQALVAHVVLRDGASATPEELRAHVKRELAGYKVPREVVLRDELPRNATGKVVKRELAG